MQIITRAAALTAGLKRYFTGLPCKHGHVSERTVCDHACVECGRLNARDPSYRASRREYNAAHQRSYRKKHPDRVRATKLKHGHEPLAAYKRALRAKNPEKHKSALSKSFQKHKAKRMEKAREWKKNNPEALSRLQRAAKSRRRAIERASEGNFTRQDIDVLQADQNFICAACPADISTHYHVDHIIPLARGGTNWPDNLQILCQPCNQSKGAKTMDEWSAWKAQMAEIYSANLTCGGTMGATGAALGAGSGAAIRTK